MISEDALSAAVALVGGTLVHDLILRAVRTSELPPSPKPSDRTYIRIHIIDHDYYESLCGVPEVDLSDMYVKRDPPHDLFHARPCQRCVEKFLGGTKARGTG